MKDAEPTENTGTSQAVFVDLAEDTESTEVSEPVVPEEVEVTEMVDTIEITEVNSEVNCTDVPEKIKAVAPRENKKQSEKCSTCMTTPPGSPQRENPKIKNISSEDTMQVETEAEQAIQKSTNPLK